MRHGVWLVAVVVGGLGATAPAVGGPAGKVVRVERRGRGARAPVVCVMTAADGGKCVEQPWIGDHAAAIAGDRIVGELVVTAVEPGEACALPWTFHARAAHGDDQPLEHANGEVALIGVALDPLVARVVEAATSPRGLPNESVYKAIDRNGDGVPDLEVVVAACSDVAASPAARRACIEVWLDDGVGWHQATHSEIADCVR